jgi:hypothetical protein
LKKKKEVGGKKIKGATKKGGAGGSVMNDSQNDISVIALGAEEDDVQLSQNMDYSQNNIKG